MSGSDTPEEIDIDLGDGRGDVVWMAKCEGMLESEEGLVRLRQFVRRYKRKGGEDGKPGDLDALIEELFAITGDDLEEQTIRDLLEGEDEDAWSPL